MSDKSHVTMEQHVCPVCGKTEDTGTILLDSRLRPRFERHTATGYGLCKEHKAMVDDGYVLLVECDPAKTRVENRNSGVETVAHPGDAYRTGNLLQVRREAWGKLFNTPLPAGGMVYIDAEAFAKIRRLTEETANG